MAEAEKKQVDEDRSRQPAQSGPGPVYRGPWNIPGGGPPGRGGTQPHEPYGSHAAGTGGGLDTVVILYIARTLLAETAQVVVELHHIVAADDAVGRVLRVARTRRAREGPVLVEEVVDADHHFAALVPEDLLAQPDVAQEVILRVIVREADILRVGRARREGEAQREDHLQVALRRVVEIAVLRLVRVQRVGGLVVGAVPREGEVDVLRNVAAQHGPEVVSHILGVVALAARNHTRRRVHRAAQHAGGLGVDDARHDVEIRFEEPDRQAVAQVRPQLPVTVEILGRRVEIGRIGLSVDGDVTGSLHQMLGRVIQRRVHREHPHEGSALFDVGVGVVEMVLIVVVLIGIVILFRDKMKKIVGDIFTTIEERSGTV